MAQERFRIAVFKVEVTPPIGHPLACGVNQRVDAPLYARGAVLDDGRARAVMVSVDFLGIAGRAYREWKGRIARAAGTSAARVFLHTIHQHDSVYVRLEADALARRFGIEPKVSAAYWTAASAKLEDAVRESVRPGRWREVRCLATAERRLEGLASNRRLLGGNRKVQAMRFSMCTDRKLKAQPVGKIDPILRTIGFLGTRGEILATMHFYATHPQVAYFRNMAGSDLPGVALGCLEKATGGRGTHLYFTGCGADVTFGKYTFPKKEKSLRVLGERLGAGLVANVRNLEEKPAGPLEFARARFSLPLARRITARKLLDEVRKSKDPEKAHWRAATLTFLRSARAGVRPEVARMSLGPAVHFLSLPSEVVVDYQLYAQALVPERFLACAAYGDYNYFYIPTAAMYAEGGYEPAAGPYAPAIEASLKGAIEEALRKLR